MRACRTGAHCIDADRVTTPLGNRGTECASVFAGDATTVHGTRTSVECMHRPMLNNSAPGDALYEPFCGTGSTIIAAETTGCIR